MARIRRATHHSVEQLLGRLRQLRSDAFKGSGEGSRGGHVIGHTKSGKAIYGPPASHVARVREHVNLQKRTAVGKLEEHADTHIHRHHKDFSDEDHADAHEAHAREASSSKHSPKVKAFHKEIANSHKARSKGKDSPAQVREAKRQKAAKRRAERAKKKEKERFKQAIGETKGGHQIRNTHHVRYDDLSGAAEVREGPASSARGVRNEPIETELGDHLTHEQHKEIAEYHRDRADEHKAEVADRSKHYSDRLKAKKKFAQHSHAASLHDDHASKKEPSGKPVDASAGAAPSKEKRTGKFTKKTQGAGQKGKVKLAMGPGRSEEVDAHLYGQWAVHGDGDVTHAPSGLRIAAFRSKRDAHSHAQHLAEHAPDALPGLEHGQTPGAAHKKHMTKLGKIHKEGMKKLMGKSVMTSEIMKAHKKGAGSRGGKIAYYTKSGKPVYQSAAKRQSPGMSKMAHNWTNNAHRSGSADDHATASKQHLAAAFYAHHAGDKTAAHDHYDHAEMHHHEASRGEDASSGGKASKRTMNWIDKNKNETAKLIGHSSAKAEKSLTEENMSQTDYNDLFKSELSGSIADDIEPPMTACVHCDTPLTKSDLIKGAGVNMTASDNNNPHSGGTGDNKSTPARTGDKAKEKDNIAPLLKSDLEAMADMSAEEQAEYLAQKGFATARPGKGEFAPRSQSGSIAPAAKPAPKPPGGAGSMSTSGGAKTKPASHKDLRTSSPMLAKKGEDGPQGLVKGAHDPGLVTWIDTGMDQQIADMIQKGEIGEGGIPSIRTQGTGE